MDAFLLSNINALVKPNDILYHLGDFSLKNPEPYLDKINCKNIHLILGNHDKRIRKKKKHYEKYFASINDLLEVKIDDKCIILCHYAMKVWDKKHYGSWQLYGHSHGGIGHDIENKSLDVGVDCWGFKPISYDFIKELLDDRN